jgi:divalent metal cation (Fe/Co/Zn/Cd) transporter
MKVQGRSRVWRHGAVGVWLNYPFADPIVDLLIRVATLHIVWDSAMSVFRRLLDGVAHLSTDVVHVEPIGEAGEDYH